MDKKGITLIEMLIVVAIIGILSAIAIPAYLGQQTRAARTEAYTNLSNLRLLEEQFFADNGCYYINPATLLCTDATITGVANIQVFLPGFQPGNPASLGFTYQIQTAGTASAFTATATGKAATRVTGDIFTIDQNNNKNF